MYFGLSHAEAAHIALLVFVMLVIVLIVLIVSCVKMKRHNKRTDELLEAFEKAGTAEFEKEFGHGGSDE